MVTLGRSDRRGTSTMGCLATLLVFAAVLYYGANIGEVYWRYYQLRDEMRSQATLAPTLNDGVIRRRLVQKVDDLDLPPEAAQFVIRRSIRNLRITIETQYEERVELPLFKHTFVFRPRAEASL